MFRLTNDNHWIKVAACAVLEQGIRASLLVWTLLVLERAWTRESSLWPLSAFIVAWLLPYAVGVLRRRLADVWFQSLYEHLVKEYARPGHHSVADWFADDRRDRDVPFMASEAHQIAQQAIDWFQSLVSLSVLVVAHVLFTCVWMSLSFAPAYVSSLLFGLALSRWFQVRNRFHDSDEQRAQAALSMRLLGSWDNIVLGNTFNRQNWENRIKEEIGALRKVRERILRAETLRSTLVFLVVILPVAVQFARFFGFLGESFGTVADTQPMAVVSFVSLIPYAAYTLARFPALFDSIHAVPRIREQLAKVDESLGVKSGVVRGVLDPHVFHPHANSDGEGDGTPSVEWHDIAFLSNGVVERPRGVDAIAKLTHHFRPGRYMILGPSGSGKTTLLLQLKALHLSQCYFFPGQNTLVFDKATDALFSPVEKLIACLHEIRMHTEGGIILLDDWDVYLDAWSAEQVSQVIDDLAQIRCVIETKRVNSSEFSF